MENEQPVEIDVGAILEQLRAEIRAAHGTLDSDSPHTAVPGVDWNELEHAVAEVEALRGVSAHWPLQWRRLRERAQVFVQRLIRRGLKWYIAPIVEQQNAYNNAVARALHLLVESNRALAAEIAQLKESAKIREDDPQAS